MGEEIEASYGTFIGWLMQRSAPEYRNLKDVELFAANNLSYDTTWEDVTRLRLLHHLAYRGDAAAIQKLENLADATATTAGGFTSLHLAAAGGHEKVVAELLDVDKWPHVKVDSASSDGITPLHLAAYGGHASVVRSLLQRYRTDIAADVNARDDVLGRTALHYAVGGCHQDVVKLLLEFPGIDLCPKDKVRNLTPLHMEVMKRQKECNSDMVQKLTGSTPYQIHHKVGTEGKPMEDFENELRRRTWSTFCPIKLFRSDKVLLRDVGYDRSSTCRSPRTPEKRRKKKKRYKNIEKKMRTADRSSSQGEWKRTTLLDRNKLETSNSFNSSEYWKLQKEWTGETMNDNYLMYKVSMRGHTALHLAATQDNAKALSHLLKCSGIDVNVRADDGGWGMTPLHCAVRTESIEAFTLLMSHTDVDVNALIKEGEGTFKRPPWTGLTLYTWWQTETAKPYKFWKTPYESDTPLHLAIRCCSSAALLKMVIKFCNHPSFKPRMYNESGVFPLDLAWLRSSCSLQFGISHVHLNAALGMLERQPGNEPIMNDVNSLRMGTQNFVNSVLVTATLLGGVTFSALLQPPVGSSPGNEYNNRAVRLFWIFNCTSFYFSMYTILCCLGTTMVTTQNTHRITGGIHQSNSTSLRLFYAHEQAQLVVPLIFCVTSGVGAFIGAGYGNLPPNSRDLLLVCTVLGLVLVLTQALLRVLFTFQLYLDVKEGVSSSYLGLTYLFRGVFIASPLEILCMPYRSNVISRSIPVDHYIYSRKTRLAVLALHVYGILGMSIYALIVA